MRDFLSQFNMTVVHCPGIWNNADPISRLENERLPTELARNLNSVTEAKLQGTSTLISTGTSTAEDPYAPSYPAPPRTLTARVLGTTASAHCSSHCFLCNADKFTEEDYTDDELQEEPIINPTTKLSIPRDTEGDDMLAKHWCKRSNVPSETLPKEPIDWAARRETISSAYFEPLENDVSGSCERDDEESLWCSQVRLRSVVLKSVGKRKVVLERPGPLNQHRVENPPSKSALQKKLVKDQTPKLTNRKVMFQEHTEAAPISRPSNPLQRRKENVEAQTQTTPADFRLANTRIPMIDDFKSIHNNLSGHHGLDYSYRKLFKHCGTKWANDRGEATKIKAQLKNFIDSCPICQKVKGLREKIASKHSFIISKPFLEVSYDFIIFKRPDKNGNRYLLVAIDNFLKIVEMKAVAHRDAETVANFLIELGARYGPMARLRSDREGSFTGLLVSKINEVRGTEAVPCIPYHPQANSICERQNAIIMDHLNALILGCMLGPDSKVAWSDLVPFVFSLVNNTPKNPLGISPLSLLYGVFANYDKPLLPTNCANMPGTTSNPLEYFESLVAWQNQLLEGRWV
jgi:hypothetical protein